MKWMTEVLAGSLQKIFCKSSPPCWREKNSLEDTVIALCIGQQHRLGNGHRELLIMGSHLANQGGVDCRDPYECDASCISEN